VPVILIHSIQLYFNTFLELSLAYNNYA
jgi:hypothetical protein